MSRAGMNGDLDALAIMLEESAERTPPPTTRGILQRIADQNNLMTHAHGAIARELSAVKTGLQGVQAELRRKADKREVRQTVDGVRRELDSVSDLADEAKQAAEITKTTQISELKKQLEMMDREKAAQAQIENDKAKDFRALRNKLIVVSVVALLAGTGWAIRETVAAFRDKPPAAATTK